MAETPPPVLPPNQANTPTKTPGSSSGSPSGNTPGGPPPLTKTGEIKPAVPLEEEQFPQPTFWQQPWVQNALPFGTSIAVHLGIFILGLIAVAATNRFVFKDTHKEQIIIPDSQLATDDQFGGIPNPGMGTDPTQKAAQDTDPTANEHGWADKKNTNLDQTLQGGGAEGGDAIAMGEGNGPGHGSGTGGGIGAGLGSGTGTGGGAEADFGPKNAGGPPGPQSKIFGHGSNVKSIVYVCDGSGSLVGGKDEALRMELKKAVNHLVLVQSFNVCIFQSGEASKKFASLSGQLLMATPNNKSKFFDFVDNKMTFHGTTDPLPAIEEAFKEHPQLIYLLTDGAFENNDPDEKEPADGPGVIAKIASLNRDKKVHVNTILLLGNKKEVNTDEIKEAEKVMKQIAKENGGTYIWAAADDL